MKWLIYNALFAVGYTLMLPRFLTRMLRRGGYAAGFSERFASYGPEVAARFAGGGRLWVHAVSVGEMFVALRFIDGLRRKQPDMRFVISTTTSTGHRMAAERKGAEDVLIYYPLDFPWIVRRALRTVRPRAIVLVETEVWPNMVLSAAREGTPVILVNGRISDRSLRGYRLMRWFLRDVFERMAVLVVQSDEDKRRFERVGAPAEKVFVAGSAKFDDAFADVPEETVVALRRVTGIPEGTQVIVGGSTWEGEERILARVYASLLRSWPGLRLVLVPRHAERRKAAERAIAGAGLKCRRRSLLGGKEPAQPLGAGEVLLVDSTGELKAFYAMASIIFVGKSLTQRGGQNMIEAARFGRPVIVGPHTENFRSVVAEFKAADAIIEVATEAGLEQAIRNMLTDGTRRNQFGGRARKVVERNRGAVERTVSRVLPVLKPR
jgi:3-deoxy-D-manno-octulosonic-acid transferase